MEPSVRAQFNDAILDRALACWEIPREAISLLDGFESFVYDCGALARIVRVSHSGRRNAAQIAGELDWINYLSEHGVTACRAVPSRHGRLAEALGTGDAYFTAAVFEKAPGDPVDEDAFAPPLFARMGRMMGRMHALAKRYTPSDPSFVRPHWFEDIVGTGERYLPPEDAHIVERFNALVAETHALPIDDDAYGLVHLDFHRGNFFVDGDDMWLFDFDDCQHSWFADDIAIALFYAVPHDCTSPRDRDFARRFMGDFLDGYARENSLDRTWLERIPMFLTRREIDLYIVIHRSFDLDHLDDPWSASFMRGRREKIENAVPYVDIDFAAL
ncbi:MAG: phosphotransferase [Gammaproteobacteria bacterium]|jgi:Ser/Thr protein kinase RdoA (MazF antagonist)